MSRPVVSVVVPTRDRAGYLDVTLRSLARQELAHPYELIVVDDGAGGATPEVAERAGARLLRTARGGGPNTARNAGIAAAEAELVALVDDDVEAPPEALRRRARVLLDVDREAELVWSANMALRRNAFERVGPFDERFSTGGDEEEWLRRLRDGGGRVVYVAAAGLDHRRAGDDARLRSLIRGAYRRGRNMRAYDAVRDRAPGLGSELRVLAGCGWHTVRRACPQGLVMGAHSAGRLVEAVRPSRLR